MAKLDRKDIDHNMCERVRKAGLNPGNILSWAIKIADDNRETWPEEFIKIFNMIRGARINQ